MGIMKNTAERKEFEAFYLQTGAEIDRQNKLFEESIATAAQQLEASLKSAMKGGSQDEYGNTSIDTPNRLAEELKIKKLQNAQFQLKKDELSQKVEDWKSKIQGLLESTDHTDEETLMETFTKKETETFSLFNFIQQINQDLENVEMAHAKLKEEMERQRLQQEKQVMEQRRLEQEKLEIERKRQEQEKIENEQRQQEQMRQEQMRQEMEQKRQEEEENKEMERRRQEQVRQEMEQKRREEERAAEQRQPEQNHQRQQNENNELWINENLNFM